MHKLIAALTLGLMLTGTTAFASPAEFEKGSVSLEIGGTLNSKVTGKGQIPAEVHGKSGFKAAVTTGLSDKLALQYKHGLFKSKESTIQTAKGPLTTYAQAEPVDINLMYKINPNLTLIAGYEHNKISYGKYVAAASKSAFHFGLTATHPLNETTGLFATLLAGQDVSLKEIGVSYNLSQVTTFNVSYAERKVKNVDLNVPILKEHGKENYNMTGITCVFAFKL